VSARTPRHGGPWRKRQFQPFATHCHGADTAGRLRVYERYGGGPQVLGADVKALLQEKRS
jgi:hypothetical protein